MQYKNNSVFSRISRQLKLFGLAALLVFSSFVYVPEAQAADCRDVEFIFARGSGEKLGGSSYTTWKNALTSELGQSSLRYNFYEVGSRTYGGNRYPAVSVSFNDKGGLTNLVGAYIGAGESFKFGKSVKEGVSELELHVKQVSSTCPNTKFVLSGYSQGAMVVMQSLKKLNSEKVIYVATFGDPKLYLPEGAGKNPDACLGRNLSNYRIYVSDCRAYKGILGALKPYETNAYKNKIGTWCNAKDIMCSSGSSISNHTEYTSRGLYNHAAATIARKVQAAYPQKTEEIKPSVRQVPHDMIILISETFAMRDHFHVYHAEAERLANQIRSLGGRVALYVYGDKKYQAVQQLCGFECTASEFSEVLRSRTIGYYGMANESYNSTLSALKISMTEVEWQVGATKSIVVLSERTYSGRDRDGTVLEDVVKLSLSIDPVNVYAFTNREAIRDMSRLTEATNGRAYDIQNLGNAISEISQRPLVGMALEEYQGLVGEPIIFEVDADIIGDAADETLRYDWDLDADGIFETENVGPRVTKTYAAPTSGFIQVRVSDASGYQSTMSARLKITKDLVTAPSLGAVQATKTSEDEFRIKVAGSTDDVLVFVNDAPYGKLSKDDSEFTLTDVSEDSHVRLIPFNEEMKGEAYNLELDSDAALGSIVTSFRDDETAPSSTNPAQNPSNGVASSKPVGSSSSSVNPSILLAQIASDVAQDLSDYTYSESLIPKAPNTGYFDELRCQ